MFIRKMISEIEPKGFKPKFEATGCYIIYKNKVLYLKRTETDDDCQEMWGTPGGKIEGETPRKNIIREIEEETRIRILDKDKNLHYVMKTFVVYPKFQFIYHLFKYTPEKMPDIELSDEHSEYKWVTPKEALKLRLVPDEDWCIQKIFTSAKAL